MIIVISLVLFALSYDTQPLAKEKDISIIRDKACSITLDDSERSRNESFIIRI